MTTSPPPGPDAAALYLDLLKGALTRLWFEDGRIERAPRPAAPGRLERLLGKRTADGEAGYTSEAGYDRALREVGLDWPAAAETMVGMQRLDGLQACLQDALARGVPGDVIETGVWRGGASILMKGVLRAHGEDDRTVWVADSFRGLPEPNAADYPADEGDTHHGATPLAVSREDVQANFARYRLLDDRVRFLEGWFKDTLPTAPIERLALMRLDGDLYESTIQALDALYPRLSPGGYVVVDDYGAVPGCKQAVHDFRDAHGISSPLVEQDWTAVHWVREG